MGGSGIDDDWDLSEFSNEARTLVLVGRIGNGKSATGNSILGKKAFKSGIKSSGITSVCEMQRTMAKDDQVINVIDTPGLFDAKVGPEEIVNCIRLAKDGIHAIIVVFSTRTRFSKEETTAIPLLVSFFGEQILNYTILLFTGGDDLEDNDMTLEDYLSECPEELQEIMRLCKNRAVLFDNKTKDGNKKAEQLQQLLALVNTMTAENNGKPFSDEFFVEMKVGAFKLNDQYEQVESLKGYSNQEITKIKENIYRSYEEQLNRITEMVERRLQETKQCLEEKLEKEQAARVKAEEFAQQAQMRSSDEIRKVRERSSDEIRILRESLEKSQRETEEFRRQVEGGRCAIL